MPGLNFAWVTVVWDEDSCLQALVLAKSLRRVVTTAEIVVLVSQNVSLQLRIALSDTFDVILGFAHACNNGQISDSLSALNEAKLYSWSLTMYQKCVVLDPSILIIKNCDELFGVSDDFSVFSSNSDNNNTGDFDDSLFITKPSHSTYAEVISCGSSLPPGSLSLNTMIKNLKDVRVNIMTPRIIERVESVRNKCRKDHVKLLSFHKAKPWLLLNVSDSMEVDVHDDIKIWIEIFINDVYPCINTKVISPFNLNLFAKLKSHGTSFTEKLPKDVHNSLKDCIAIVGQSVRMPGANNVEEFWEMLKSGGDGISTIPMDRLPEYLSHDPRFTSIQAGFLKCPIDEFDAKFFGISPREAAFMDPQQRLMVEVAWEALEDAAINPQTLKGSNTGVFTGIWTHEYERLLSENTTGKDFHHIILGNAYSATSARVSYFLGLNGPNVATESGCSSSMVALHLACDSLRKRETDLALATGVNLLITNVPYSEISILANDGRCKTFDETADGFSRAEGVAVVVLKRLSDAVKDGDRILSVVRGSGISNEGTTSSFGTPSKYCQQIAITEAIKASGVKPEDVDYVEAHGTGTPIGDPIEFAAISAAYKAEREKPLVVGSVKTNTGHTESAAGLAGLVKVILAMQNEIIPPHRNLTVMNPNIDLDSLPAVIPINAMEWPKNANKRRLAGVSSFGISGTNVHVILEEPPEFPKIQLESFETERTHHILTLSAKTENSLKDLADSYSTFVEKHPESSLEDICFTANIGRQHHKYRKTFVVKNLEELTEKLEKTAFNPESKRIEKPKIAFLVTGQGSQYSGMAKTLYKTSPVFKQAFNECNEILLNNARISLPDVLWNQGSTSNTLDETIYSQTSIFCVEYSLLKMWESWGIKPDYVLGHSVGEFAASVAAGFMTLQDAVLLVAERSRLIHKLPPGGMLAIRSNKETVDDIIESFSSVNPNDWLDIAVINSPDELVVAGKTPSLKKLTEVCESRNIKTQILAASHAFHSRDMEGMLNEFGNIANKIEYKVPNCKYVSGSTGKVLCFEEMNGKYWQNHARNSVDFTKGMKLIHEEGCNVFIEIGANPILLALGMSNLPPLDSQNFLWLPSIRKNEENWVTILNSVSKLYIHGLHFDWKGFDAKYMRKKITIPHYQFQRQKYWIGARSEPLTKPLHPLLGRKVPLAVVKDSVYQHIWDLNDFTYLRDHQVANIIVLPGAGYLEIILAAGCEAFQGETDKNIFVEDFVIEAPMELVEDALHKVQVVASEIEDSESLFVRVFMYKSMNGYNDEKGWKQFASANVSCTKSSNLVANDTDAAEDPPDFATIKSRCLEELCTNEFYEKTVEIGISFGETFQSISKVWKGTKEIIAEIPCPTKAGSMKEYIFHPIVLDAMIQAVGLSISDVNSDLCLPVGIQSFTMLEKSDSDCFFAHVFGEEGNTRAIVHLYNDKSQLVAIMYGVRLIKTSISSFMNVIDAHKNRLPGMYEINWRYRDSVLHSRVNLLELPNCNAEDVDKLMVEQKHWIYKGFSYVDLGLTGCKYGIIPSLYELGWRYNLGDRISLQMVMTDLVLVPSQSNYVQRLLDIITEDGYCRKEINAAGEPEWIYISPFMPFDQAMKEGPEMLAKYQADNDNVAELPIYIHCLKNLHLVISGKRNGIDVLFGNEDPQLNPLVVYTDGFAVSIANQQIRVFLQTKLSLIKTSGSIVRVLEVGAGSGATSLEILQGLQKAGIPCRYTFTDITPHFLEQAKEKLKKYSGVDYKVLNIEKDPKYQGFSPHSYDIIVAANVIHATEYLEDAIRNVRQLLAPNGTLILQELLEPERNMDIIYGLMEGFWRFKDFHIRKDHPCVNLEIWTKILTENGFRSVENISREDEFVSNLIAEATDINPKYVEVRHISNEETKLPTWVIISGTDNTIGDQLKVLIENAGDNVVKINHYLLRDVLAEDSSIFVDYTDKEQFHEILKGLNEKYNVKGWFSLNALDEIFNLETVVKTFLYMAQYLASATQTFRMLTATRGAFFIGDQGLGNPAQAILWGSLKSCKHEITAMDGSSIDFDPDKSDPAIESAQLFYEMWNFEHDHFLAYRNNKRHVMKFCPLQSSQAPLVLPSGRYEIVVPKTKKIEDVCFTKQETKALESNDVEISVKATALNFRDILVIIKLEQYHTLVDSVGCDFSGVVTQVGNSVTKYTVGDEVFGMSNASSVASHVIVDSDLILHKPKEFTFAEACTVPAVFLTAYYCLVFVADLKQGETILIHVASGGVGLVAIQIAQRIGANIIATAGNKRKRAYLRSLGLKHVFHSRDLTYGDEILKATNEKGVDVVLNSLTGQGFKETSLKVCAQNARFVEMGKVNIWQPEEVETLRNDVKYTIVNLEVVMRDQRDEMDRLMVAMKKLMKDNTLKPLPYTRFFVSQIKDALNYFLKAQHIGKVVVTMPELKESLGKKFTNDLVFNSNGTYLVTGGLGGIGLEVAKWMVKCGARNVVLVGRTAPDENTAKVLKSLSTRGCRVLSRQVDVGEMDQCVELFKVIKSEMPPLRGVIHSAGTLSDALILNQTWEKFETVFQAKYKGGWNLHTLTKDLSLEHFVLFSSMAAIVGGPGQANHSGANSYLDALAYYRHSLGLPAQTINWGAWSELGAAKDTAYGKEGVYGIKPFTPTQGISALKYTMSRPIIQLAVIQIVSTVFIENFPSPMLSELIDTDSNIEAKNLAQAEQFWSDIEGLAEEERALYIKDCIESIIRQTLKLPESETIDEHQTFSEMGLDSLMAVEMRNKLQHIFGKYLTLNPTSLLDYPTLATLSKYLAELTMSVNIEELSLKNDVMSPQAILELAMQDSVLPDNIQKLDEPVLPSQIKNIFLTGVTGHFGPYILNELHRNGSDTNTQIFCLIRTKTLADAERLFEANLKKFKLLDSTDMSRVTIVVGDISKENFGMAKDDYEKLANKIDVIFHCAVKANHIEPYKKSKSRMDIRSVNVFGTVEVLKFASSFKTKRVIFTSSYSAINELGEDGFVSEELPSEKNTGEGLAGGYSLTKFVGEKLMNQALQRGIPCTVLRFPTLLGNSETGLFTPETNFVMNFLFSAGRMKMFVDAPGRWYSMAVDIVAKISACIVFNDNAETGLYNIVDSVPFTFRDMLNVATDMGFELKAVDKNEFKERMIADDNPFMTIFKEAVGDKDPMDIVLGFSPTIKFALDENKEIFNSGTKLRAAVKDFDEMVPLVAEVIRRQIKYAKDSGMLEKLDIKLEEK